MLSFSVSTPLASKRPRPHVVLSSSRRPTSLPRASVTETPASTSRTAPLANTSCGFATLLGPSNSGKSTLLNRLIGQKVAIVSPKVQTTRCRVSGIAIFGDTQVVFLDTPGIFSATNRLSRAMVKSAWRSGRDADAVAVVLDAADMYHSGRRAQKRDLDVSDAVRDVLKGVARRSDVCVCANKMDAVPNDAHEFVLHRLRCLLDECGVPDAADVRALSARTGDGVGDLVEWTVKRMPKGPWLYPEDEATDMPARLLAAEVVREAVFRVLKQELPYEIAVETTAYKALRDGSVRVAADLLVARNSQKRIVTGTEGRVIKEIGTRARREMREVIGTEVHLFLTVKVRGKWKEDRRQYQQWGLDYDA